MKRNKDYSTRDEAIEQKHNFSGSVAPAEILLKGSLHYIRDKTFTRNQNVKSYSRNLNLSQDSLARGVLFRNFELIIKEKILKTQKYKMLVSGDLKSKETF